MKPVKIKLKLIKCKNKREKKFDNFYFHDDHYGFNSQSPNATRDLLNACQETPTTTQTIFPPAQAQNDLKNIFFFYVSPILLFVFIFCALAHFIYKKFIKKRKKQRGRMMEEILQEL